MRATKRPDAVGMGTHLQEPCSLLVFVLQRRELVAEPARRIVEALGQQCRA